MIRQNSQIDHNKDGKIQYVVLEGEAGHQDAIIRTENAVDTLNKNGIELEKVKLPDCELEPGAGAEPDGADAGAV